MLTLEQIKDLRTARIKHRPFKLALEVPIGMTVITEDLKNIATIIGVSDGSTIELSSPIIYGGKSVQSLTFKEAYEDLLISHPQTGQLLICGQPDDAGIITK